MDNVCRADAQDIKDAVNRIYESKNLEDLQCNFAKEVRGNPRYHDLLNAANYEMLGNLTSSSPDSVFNKEKNKIQKEWIISFLLNYFIFLVIAFSELNSFSEGIVFSMVLGCLMSIVYYSAFKKSGTRMLTYIVFSAPLQMLLSFSKEGIDLSQASLIGMGIFGFYWWNCFKLRQLNYLIRGKQQLNKILN